MRSRKTFEENPTFLILYQSLYYMQVRANLSTISLRVINICGNIIYFKNKLRNCHCIFHNLWRYIKCDNKSQHCNKMFSFSNMALYRIFVNFYMHICIIKNRSQMQDSGDGVILAVPTVILR